MVTATIQDSNLWCPGGTWTLRAEIGANGGSRLTVIRDRRAKGVKARLFEGMLKVVGSRMLAAELRKAPAPRPRGRHELGPTRKKETTCTHA